MAVEYKEFLTYPGWDESRKASEVLPKAQEAANAWLADNTVRVLNIETLAEVDGGGMTTVGVRYKGIRVWFERPALDHKDAA